MYKKDEKKTPKRRYRTEIKAYLFKLLYCDYTTFSMYIFYIIFFA